MFHYLYKITKLDTGQYYFGVRSSPKPPREDIKYLGSGKLITASIKKYGSKAFSKSIIAECKTREEANILESQIVTKDILCDDLCLNLIPGGGGSGWLEKKRTHKKKPRRWTDEERLQISLRQIGVPKAKHTPEANKRKSERMKGVGIVMSAEVRKSAIEKAAAKAKQAYADGTRTHHYLGKHRTLAEREAISKSLLGNTPWNKGVTLTHEHRYKIGEAQRGKHDRISVELCKIGWTYDIFKAWVLDLHAKGLGPIKIWKSLPQGCKISDRPIKTIIKEQNDQLCKCNQAL